jgi:hypothetical protein
VTLLVLLIFISLPNTGIWAVKRMVAIILCKGPAPSSRTTFISPAGSRLCQAQLEPSLYLCWSFTFHPNTGPINAKSYFCVIGCQIFLVSRQWLFARTAVCHAPSLVKITNIYVFWGERYSIFQTRQDFLRTVYCTKYFIICTIFELINQQIFNRKLNIQLRTVFILFQILDLRGNSRSQNDDAAYQAMLVINFKCLNMQVFHIWMVERGWTRGVVICFYRQRILGVKGWRWW